MQMLDSKVSPKQDKRLLPAPPRDALAKEPVSTAASRFAAHAQSLAESLHSVHSGKSRSACVAEIWEVLNVACKGWRIQAGLSSRNNNPRRAFVWKIQVKIDHLTVLPIAIKFLEPPFMLNSSAVSDRFVASLSIFVSLSLCPRPLLTHM